MELSEFVEQTIRQLVEGVAGAQRAVEGSGAHVNRATQHGGRAGPDQWWRGGSWHQPVRFDVAIEASEQAGSSGKAGVVVASIGLGGAKSEKSSMSSTNRVQFMVPLALPEQGKPAKA